ncbi:hypothetical protein [Brevibacillus parabrevis]|uniref:hypothetical protein n=1 Tax=Brevibacillus parabrevis TaxID=54914 RepID=UPI0012F4D338|nr:hypothetical protein [Brevibacillus parabrevis]
MSRRIEGEKQMRLAACTAAWGIVTESSVQKAGVGLPRSRCSDSKRRWRKPQAWSWWKSWRNS